MNFAVGFLAGVGATWAALAIWQQLPPFRAIDDIDPDDVPPQRYKTNSAGRRVPDLDAIGDIRLFEEPGHLDQVMPASARRALGYDSISFSIEGGRVPVKQIVKHARSSIPIGATLVRVENTGAGIYRATYQLRLVVRRS